MIHPLLTLPTLATAAAPALNGADTAWMMIATALVLVMTPGLAFFYGGLVRSKNALNTKMMSFAAMGFIGVLWALIGFSLAFSGDGKWIGNFAYLGLRHVGLAPHDPAHTIPFLLFMAYQTTFAIITPALISGAIVERMRFRTYLLFIALWSLLVYAPVAHWIWGGGWLSAGHGDVGVMDFAGGAVVHITAGVAALVAASLLGPRKDYSRQALLPHNVPFVLLGTGLLWLGWFGFNAGSALAANPQAVLAFVNSLLAPCAALVVWSLLDMFRGGRITAVGSATAIVVGLATITPAAGFVAPSSALIIGAIAAFPSYYAILYRAKTRLDDSLDVFSAHGLGGITGMLLVGVFCRASIGGVPIPGSTDGALMGHPDQLGRQALAVLVVGLYSGVATFVILKLVGLVMPLRATGRQEDRGLDIGLHGEEAYTTGEGALLLMEHERPVTTSANPAGPKPRNLVEA